MTHAGFSDLFTRSLEPCPPSIGRAESLDPLKLNRLKGRQPTDWTLINTNESGDDPNHDPIRQPALFRPVSWLFL
jgi:hypothetical protein